MAEDNLLELLDGVLKQARAQGATAADAVLFDSMETGLTQRMGKPEGLERSESKALGLRVFDGQRSAMVSSTDLSQAALEELAERAAAMAKVAPEDNYAGLAPEELLVKEVPGLDLLDAQEPSPDQLKRWAAETEEAAMAVEGITNSEGADAGYNRTRVAVAGTNGFAGEYAFSNVSLSISVLAGEGTKMERDYAYSLARHASDVEAPEAIGRRAAERTLKRLNPRRVKSCQAPVVYDPRVGNRLLSHFASAVSGAAVARGTSFLKEKMGANLFGKAVTIVDDPHRKRGLGSKPFDGEGVANARLELVKNGVLQHWLLDVRSGNQLGMPSNGRAARSTGSPPSPSATNLYLEAGEVSPEALIADIQSGLYITDAFGGGANPVTGDFSQGASGFWIENGEITYPVSELTVAGHLLHMFETLAAADDLEFRYRTNVPTLRFEGMTVAGDS